MIKGGHEHFELFHHRFLVVGGANLPHLLQLSHEPRLVDGHLLADEDLFVGRLLQALFLHEQLFKELFARAQTGELYLDVLIGGVAHHGDEVFRKREYLDRFAHVEDEDLAALGESARLEHQTHRLRYGHEVTDDIGVGDGDGTAVLDLLLKERNDRTVGAEHVAEAHRGELRLAARLRHHLHDLFAAALGSAHHVGGVHGFIGGDHDELLHAVLIRHLRHVQSAEDVVLARFFRVGFHERNVLVRRRVEDYLGLMFGEQLVHLIPVRDRGYLHPNGVIRAVCAQYLLLNFVGGVLVDVHDNHLGGVVLDYLPYELGTDRAAAARYHAHLALDVGGNALVGKGYLRAAKQVAYIDVTDLADHIRRAHQLADVRQHLHLAARGHTGGEHALARLRAYRRYGEDYRGYGIFGDQAGNFLRGADYGHAVDDSALLFDIVVHQADGDVYTVFTAEFFHHRAARTARAHYHGALAVGHLNLGGPIGIEHLVNEVHHRHGHRGGKRHYYIHGEAAVDVAHDKFLGRNKVRQLIHARKEQCAAYAGEHYAHIFLHARKAPHHLEYLEEYEE